MQPKVSLFLSAIRTQWWELMLNSLKSTKIPIEVIFVGNVKPNFIMPDFAKHIYSDKPPAYCYEIGRRACKGELIHWTADDAEYSPGVIDEIYEQWKGYHNPRNVMSCQCIENTHVALLSTQRFFQGFNQTPLMAPLGFMDRQYLEDLGGIDRRFTNEQYENDIVMRVYRDGGDVKMHLHKGWVELDHLRKHTKGQHITGEQYRKDREVLEYLWVKDGKVTYERKDEVQRFTDEDLGL